MHDLRQDDYRNLTEEGAKTRKRLRVWYGLLLFANAVHLICAVKFDIYPADRFIALVFFCVLCIVVGVVHSLEVRKALQMQEEYNRAQNNETK